MSTSVIIIGSGVAGPVLAMLLKQKGFSPVIYERQADIGGTGALGISPQTFKVLNILGLADDVIALGRKISEVVLYSEYSHRELMRSDGPSKLPKAVGWPLVGINRQKYNRFLWESANARGIEVHMGMRLVGIEQEEGGEKATAVFEDGTKAEADIIVGCDGLHSAVRTSLFGEEEVSYMGICQVAGISAMPESLRTAPAAMRQFFGSGSHMLVFPLSETEVVWAQTLPEAEQSKEDWKAVEKANAEEILKTLPAAGWEGVPQEVLKGAGKVIKYGLYERPILPVWHKGRVVLCGDAAHPTSPHAGQGANQAMEDCYHLTRLLVGASPHDLASLDAAFTAFAQLRIPTVTQIVTMAKREGHVRVIAGDEACKARDESLGKPDRELMKVQLQAMKGPFEGESEI